MIRQTNLVAKGDCSRLEAVHTLLSEVIEKASGDGGRAETLRIEAGLTRIMTKEWNNRATAAIRAALRGLDLSSERPVTSAEAAGILKRLGEAFNGIEAALAPRVKQDIARVYEIGKGIFRDRHQVRPRGRTKRLTPYERLFLTKDAVTPLIRLTSTSTDRETVDSLVRLHLLAIGDHYGESKKAQIAAFIEDAVVGRGLPKREAGQFLMDELTRRLGGFTEAVPPSLRRQGQEAARSYFEGLSATSITRARAFSSLNLMAEAGITSYRWASIVDSRTSEICLAMEGRLFSVELGQAQMQKILSQRTAGGLKEAAPWRDDLSEFDLSRGVRLDSFDVANLLAAQGVPIVPPAHFRCRSELIPA